MESPDVGSSPLARGALPVADEYARSRWLIPARAGSTGPQGRRPPWGEAHPRSRGEHQLEVRPIAQRPGSSPLARGAQRRQGGVDGGLGLIPARAGSTGRGGRCRRGGAAHPRSRGEHHRVPIYRLLIRRGSSPLARGARLRVDGEAVVDRLIPARAGSTTPSPARGSSRPAHPRSRGEHIVLVLAAIVAGGSSPLARGARQPRARARHDPGLIPARAGSTLTRAGTPTRCPAHPRSRGEHETHSTRSGRLSGSSPLARGARAGDGRRARAARLIPARAGSTASRSTASCGSTAHPRSRGEHGQAPIR